ncbi:MAG: hypothetical protein J5I47_10230 [Vicingus serpentipes]|nr:hypothetical protein [Vicingus serpentipes]
MKKALTVILILIMVSCRYNKEELPTPKNNSTPTPTYNGPVITYTNHTKKLFDNYCIACHAPGASVSFWPLTSYTEVSVYTNPGGKIQVRVLDQGNMPPTGSASGFLTPAEKDTLQMWLDQGAPQ